MEKKTFSPWKWQDERSYVQAVEVKNNTGTLYCSGQAAIDSNGISSNEDMKSQLQQSISNLEEVITSAGYECEGIVRLNVYTTSMEELWPHFPILQEWIARHNIKQALTAMEVNVLFETLKVELEATVVK
ncbi:RidA family protein [Pedobacter chinensis]|uniref:RidA family protein n=1 Tax=Pedobacter chinensis TaxID=2282421 RepID=A0A369PW20_9SPHI|nr:RidA family protein [Pedobacter chinensis]RDC56440.1 RidA family protein [Pedobacter chinensis]